MLSMPIHLSGLSSSSTRRHFRHPLNAQATPIPLCAVGSEPNNTSHSDHVNLPLEQHSPNLQVDGMASRSSAAVAVYGPTASRALSYLTERAEDAQAAVLGILSGKGPSAAAAAGRGHGGVDDYLGDVDLTSGEKGVRIARDKLESSVWHERIQGLRTVVAMISKSLPAANHLFPSVLKLTSAPSLQVKTLVYLITLRLAPSQPDVALLSINSFQRDLSDHSPLIRGMALRVLSGLGVKMAVQLMQMAIAKSVRDPSFYVRRIAADAIGKCFELSKASLSDLLPSLQKLLADRHPAVLGSALLAFQCTVPDRYDLLHPHFRRICTALVDIDEWNQPIALRILTAYARTNLAKPSEEQTKQVADPHSEKVVPGRTRWGQGLDKDLELLLNKAEPLLCSRNAAVVLSASHLYLSLLPLSSSFHTSLVGPLIGLIHLHPSQAYLALLFIRGLNQLRPDLFASHASYFVPGSAISGEPEYVTAQKLDLLVDLSLSPGSTSSRKLAMSELQEAVSQQSSPVIVERAVAGLGRLAMAGVQTSDEEQVEKCIDVLLSVLKGQRHAKVISQVTNVLTQVVQARAANGIASQEQGQVLYRLSQLLFKSDSSQESPSKLLSKTSLHDGDGRAVIYWLLGQYSRSTIEVLDKSLAESTLVKKTLAETILPDLLRKASLHFSHESKEAKLSILTLSSKLVALLPTLQPAAVVLKSVVSLHNYLLQLARFDACIDVRDRARYYKSLTSGCSEQEDDQQQQQSSDSITSTSGIRLRREQVLMILFDDVAQSKDMTTTSSPSDQDASTLLDPLHLPSSKNTPTNPLPRWNPNPQLLPPSSIRDGEPAPTPLQSTASAVRSISSNSIPQTSSDTRSLSSSPIPHAPSAVVSKGKGKYQDLDEFLDDDSSSEGGSDEELEQQEEEDSSEEEESEEEESESESEQDSADDLVSER
ncbi:unnamed protein product [Sympodiomycopsis kandeliae]